MNRPEDEARDIREALTGASESPTSEAELNRQVAGIQSAAKELSALGQEAKADWQAAAGAGIDPAILALVRQHARPRRPWLRATTWLGTAAALALVSWLLIWSGRSDPRYPLGQGGGPLFPTGSVRVTELDKFTFPLSHPRGGRFELRIFDSNWRPVVGLGEIQFTEQQYWQPNSDQQGRLHALGDFHWEVRALAADGSVSDSLQASVSLR